jgi:PAS domain-containing protein
VICTSRNISERQRSEDALRESGVQIRALVHGATYGIYQSTLDGRLTIVNPSLVPMPGFESGGDLLGLNARTCMSIRGSATHRAISKEPIGLWRAGPMEKAGRHACHCEVEWTRPAKSGR